MEFRLMYKGKLPSAANQSRAKEKHQIRKQLHPQIRELWKQSPLLKNWFEQQTEGRANIEFVADRYTSCGHRFVPLIRQEHFHACELEILFLRREAPGSILQGGDIDNRIKVLFDALKLPRDCSGVGSPEDDEKPFFCLLEDDQIITDVRVTTDRLLLPSYETGHPDSEVFLLIQVRTKPIDHRGMFQLDLH